MKAVARRGAAALAGAMLATAAAFAAGGEAASRWQCTTPGSATTAPEIAGAARDYLARVEVLYPNQVLGLVRAGERFYLVNSVDIEWGARTRLALLALRLPEPYLTEEQRRTLGATPGAASAVGGQLAFVIGSPAPAAPGIATSGTRSHAVDTALGVTPGGAPPPGGFICLAMSRAEREGLVRTAGGEVVLSAGRSVHLVNPQEPEVAVEVRAAADRALNLGDIFQRSARAGIYAGLVGQARQAGAATTLERPDGTLTFRTASVGSSAIETRPEPREAPVAVAATEKPLPLAPAPENVAAIAPPREPAVPVRNEPVIVTGVVAPGLPLERTEQPAADAVPPAPAVTAAAPPSGVPAPTVAEPVAPPPVMVATAPPAVSAPAGRRPAVIPAIPAGTTAAQPYDEYASAMRTLMALKRSGSVRSVSEMTYVHPAVEILRQQR